MNAAPDAVSVLQNYDWPGNVRELRNVIETARAMCNSESPTLHAKDLIFAHERDIAFLDLLPVLRRHVGLTDERLYLSRDPHLNNRGHEVVGSELARWFKCCLKNRHAFNGFDG